MEIGTGTVDLGLLARPDRVVFESQQAAVERLRAENAALSTRNRRLEEHGPEAMVEDLRAKVASLTERNRRLEHLLRELRRTIFGKKSEKLHPRPAPARVRRTRRRARRGRGRRPGEHDA